MARYRVRFRDDQTPGPVKGEDISLTTTSDFRRVSRSSLALVAVLALAGCSSSTSGFTDEGSDDNVGIEQNLIKGLMTSMGAIDPREKPIEYKPRSPLVVPPQRNLPTPQNQDALLNAHNFPRNQEDVDREFARNAAKNAGDPGRAMTLGEQARFRLPSGTQAKITRPVDEREASRPLTPAEMAGQGEATRAAMAEVEGSSAPLNQRKRRLLTDPPEAYRTPSDKAPVEMAEEKSSLKPTWWPF